MRSPARQNTKFIHNLEVSQLPDLTRLDRINHWAVTDPSTSAIDRVYDLVDSALDGVDRVLNSAKYEEQHQVRRANAKKVETIDTAPATSTALATRRFRIIEAIAAESGITIFVVTNGSVRAECTTRELAEKILRGLETAP
jgi:exosome complex RNA-binding protein Rrp4